MYWLDKMFVKRLYEPQTARKFLQALLSTVRV